MGEDPGESRISDEGKQKLIYEADSIELAGGSSFNKT